MRGSSDRRFQRPSVKDHIAELIQQALLVHPACQEHQPEELNIVIDRCKQPEHGDFACNIALMLAKKVGMVPMKLAQELADALPKSQHIAGVEVAKPGFINFRINNHCRVSVIRRIHEAGEAYGTHELEEDQRITVEFVSANPTGPLHVGHGRGAAYGSSLSNVLEACGYEVHREYYVNDAGRQMDILATSVWLRYLELSGVQVTFPSNGYKGDYIIDIARALHIGEGDTLSRANHEVTADVPADEPEGGDKEAHIDALVRNAKTLLGDGYQTVFDAGLNAILKDIREDLGEFGVTFQEWFSERSLGDDGYVQRAIDTLQANGHLYKKDGAVWFKATEFDDDKDRVVVRENGATTYFASDLGYLLSKFERGFDRAIYIFGADHHGYLARMLAAAKGLGLDPDKVEFLLVQFAVLYEGDEKIQMSTRSGQFVTLRELREDVGNDAARFFYVMRSNDQHLDFDLKLARERSNENPVYYIQYAHARICALMRQLEEKLLKFNRSSAEAHRDQLTEAQAGALMDQLMRYPEVVDNAGRYRAPQHIANYLRELASAFHSYYNAVPIVIDDEGLRNARLSLALATKQVIANGLGLLGVDAPEHM